MRQRVYIETSVVSYLTARPTRDLVSAARQAITREWWQGKRAELDLFTSQVAIEEARQGDPEGAARRLEILAAIPKLEVTSDAIALARALVKAGVLPRTAVTDALHIAVATLGSVDILLTWNCRHLANASFIEPVAALLRKRGHKPPIVCTPEYVLGEP